ncbi:hypothetical protein Plhal304r1_c042g0121501 [Plasmopara halstedii]
MGIIYICGDGCAFWCFLIDQTISYLHTTMVTSCIDDALKCETPSFRSNIFLSLRKRGGAGWMSINFKRWLRIATVCFVPRFA